MLCCAASSMHSAGSQINTTPQNKGDGIYIQDIVSVHIRANNTLTNPLITKESEAAGEYLHSSWPLDWSFMFITSKLFERSVETICQSVMKGLERNNVQNKSQAGDINRQK